MRGAQQQFHKRQKSVRRKHIRMANGYVTKLDRNGVIIQKPDNKAGGFGVRLLVLLGICFIAFKILLVTNLGAEEYLARLDALEQGKTYQQVGAWLMGLDPVTVFASTQIEQFLG